MSDVWYKGVCTECGSDQSASYMERSKFQEPPCKYCGGVVNVIRDNQDKEAFLARKNTERGIGHNDGDDEE